MGSSRVTLAVVHRRNPNGVVLWRGASAFNGMPVVVVVTGLYYPPENQKTGNMLQSWILADSGETPQAAADTGEDVANCGDCGRRKNGTAGRCYVRLYQAPRMVYASANAGAYPDYRAAAHDELLRGRLLRLGAYGDPAAVPFGVWPPFVALSGGHTGYTHAWRHCDQRFRSICHASCDTSDERRLASWMGWRTFRVRRPGEPLLPGEFACPGAAESDRRLDCAHCMACGGGAQSGRTATPCEVEH